MRNHLAEDLLNKEMCVPTKRAWCWDILELDYGTFRETQCPDSNLSRFKTYHRCNGPQGARNSWYICEMEEGQYDEHVYKKQREKFTWFWEMCKCRLKKSSASTVPNRRNSDLIRNVLSTTHTLHNDVNTNSTYMYLKYCRSVNTVFLGPTSSRRKSNFNVIKLQIYIKTGIHKIYDKENSDILHALYAAILVNRWL